MGCFGSFRGQKEVSAKHKFEYINLKDFKANSFFTCTAYVWVYLSVLIAFLCVAADTYTAITLLAFNRWSSQIRPIIPFDVAKIIFALCIGLSYVLYIIDWWHAVGVINRGGVADAYMDSIALRWHSIRGGEGREDTGWKRFLVFARLTEKRGRRDYVALFTYFSFKGWLRVLFAEGPRVVINTATLVSVIRADLIPEDATEALGAIGRFFENVGHLYSENKIQALILGAMTFTTIFWFFTIIRLTIACNMYLCYLLRAIDETSLEDYCRKRVDKRMTKIVEENHKQGLGKNVFRQPTIPVISIPEDTSTPNIRNSLTESPVSYLGRQRTIPDLGPREFPPRLKRADTTTTISGSTYSQSSTPPPPHVNHYSIYSPLHPQHSIHNSYDSNAPLISAPAENPYSDPTFPTYPSPTHPPLGGGFPVSPQGQQQPVPAYQRPVYRPAAEAEVHQWPTTGPAISRSTTVPHRARQLQEVVARSGTAPPGPWNEGWDGQGQRGYWPQ
ncbi:unnamed protein product [Tuber aestivum]|uniref:Vacuolar membrane protein n=1 Tax=Tuber aestivum TaxID=59557 RepID=A0A292Q188_9PEZI|nr:unnamed protein product [Tuber aestivum]